MSTAISIASPLDTAPRYLPAITAWTVEATAVDPREELLSALAEKVIPFTIKQEKAFSWARTISQITKTYLGPRGYTIVISLGVTGGLAGVRLAKYFGVPDESVGTDAIPFAIGAAIGSSLGIAGMLFTGTFPDMKSDAADEKVLEMSEVKTQFNTAAMHLVSCVWSQNAEVSTLARERARKISEALPDIRLKISAALQNGHEERIVRHLQAAVDYIQSKGTRRVLLPRLERLIIDEQRYTRRQVPFCFDPSSEETSSSSVSSTTSA